MAALMVTIIIQRRIGYRTWHTLHYGLYAAFALAAVHTSDHDVRPEVLGEHNGGRGRMRALGASGDLFVTTSTQPLGTRSDP